MTIHLFESMLTAFADISKYPGQDPTEDIGKWHCYIRNGYLERGELTEPQCNLEIFRRQNLDLQGKKKVVGRGGTENENEQRHRSILVCMGNHDHSIVTVALCIVSE